MKGIELGTTKRMSEVIVETDRRRPPDRVVVVSGPNLAPEIAVEQPAATVVACTDERARRSGAARRSRTPYFRPYTNDDVIGCELGGAVKNVIALAYGMATAMGFGDNTRATLITRGLAETARLGVALGADPITFAGLAGLGDLVGYLLVAAVPQPHLRRAPGPGRDPGAGAGGHPADRRGREELPGHPGPGPRARRGDADHRAGRAGLPRGRGPEVAVAALMSRDAKPESYE